MSQQLNKKENTVIKVSNLKKTFGDLTAVDNLSFDVYKGEIFGFLGPNGAGKTTSINMICGLIESTAGDVTILGNGNRKKSQIICCGSYPFDQGFNRGFFMVFYC